MNKYRFFITIAFSFLLINSVFSQKKNECRDFHKSRFCWIPDSYDFKQYFKAKSAQVEINKVYKHEVVLTANKDYKIGVCTYTEYGPVRFVITDKETEQIIYDNSMDEFMESVGFTVKEVPITVYIEVTIMASDVKPKDMEDMRVCMGIQILYRRFGKEGF
jgi:hypothetical protein